MSRKKSINSYYQQKAAEKKKAAAEKRNKILLIIAVAVLAVAVVAVSLYLIITSVSNAGDEDSKFKPIDYPTDPVKVALEVKDYGTITLELYPEYAPRSVKNFVEYVEEGFYDGLTFHRVIEDFMIQGGDPKGTGAGDDSLPTILGEFSENGFENTLSFDRGVIGMARSTDYDSASSQFFICHKDTPTLNGLYAAFGKVIEGIEVVDAIATCEKTDTTDAQGNHYIPAETVVIERAYVVE